MKCKALFFTLSLLPFFGSSQNLVPNGSFEDYVSCPEYLDGMEFVEHWYKSIQEPGVDYYQNPSPDYFHECAVNEALGVPDNAIGNQLAYDGMAYSGLILFHSNTPNAREILGVSLSSPIIPGQTYYCSLYLVRPVGWPVVGLATNNLGLKFSNSEMFLSTDQAIDGNAHLKIEEIATDSVNWILLYGEITPDQSYQYLHIGNFYSDDNTDVQVFTETAQQGYYFIDDVRVSTEPLVITSEAENIANQKIAMYPNPVSDVVNIVSSAAIARVELFCVSGRLINKFAINGESNFSINVEYMSQGLYIAIIHFENENIEVLKFNKN